MNTASLRKLVLISLLSTIGFLIMYLAFPLPLLPPFLTLDFSDLPALIGAIMLGPGAGILIEAIKNILHVLLTGSLTVVPVGEIANFLAGSILILVCWLFYKRKRSAGSLAFGMILGTLLMTGIMAVANYYVIMPGYALFLGYSTDLVIAQSQDANQNINSLITYIVYGVMPFNLIKGIALTVLMIPVYVRLKQYIEKSIIAH